MRATWWIAASLLLRGADARAEVGSEIAARVVLESPGDGGKSNWVDFVVEGIGVPSIERCERLVDKELKHVYPAGVSIKAKLSRACLGRPLPATPPMLDPQILRITEPLPSLDLMAVGAPPTKGHIIRNTRMLSGVECEKRRDKLIAAAREAQKESKGALDDEARLNQEQIRKACEREPPHAPKKRTRGQKNKWLEADAASSRCEQAKRMGEILAEKRGEKGGAGDGIERACVRE